MVSWTTFNIHGTLVLDKRFFMVGKKGSFNYKNVIYINKKKLFLELFTKGEPKMVLLWHRCESLSLETFIFKSVGKKFTQVWNVTTVNKLWQHLIFLCIIPLKLSSIIKNLDKILCTFTRIVWVTPLTVTFTHRHISCIQTVISNITVIQSHRTNLTDTVPE